MPSDIKTSRFHRLRHTPMRDVLRGRLSARLDWRGRLAAAALPEAARQLIGRVVKRTRLWRIEKSAVADELLAHFLDGLAAGESVDDLLACFGDERHAAKLIRRGKIRNRPIWWHARRWMQRMFLALVVIYLGLMAYFFVGHPSPSVDYVAELNQPLLNVPESDRAWPIYRRAILAMQTDVTDRNGRTFKAYPDWMFDSIDGKHWPEMQPWLRSHAADLELLRQGAQKSVLGFVLGKEGSWRDPELGWGNMQYGGSIASNGWPKDERTLIYVLLPFLNETRTLGELLQADAKLAIVDGDGPRLERDLCAIIGLARQHMGGGQMIVTQTVGHGIYDVGLDAIQRTLLTNPSLLTNDQWTRIVHTLSGPEVAADMVSLNAERDQFYDFVQRTYTDDGHGNGHLTREGMRFLTELMPPHGTPYFDRQWFSNLVGPATAPLVASRREILSQYDLWMEQMEANFRQPVRNVIPGDIEPTLRMWKSSTLNFIRYVPLLTLMPSLDGVQTRIERLLGRRDGLLVGIALELYHRERGNYPDSLAQLTPKWLPTVPLDRITGEPVQYRLIDGRPHVYSVGVDRIDNGGVPVMNRGITPVPTAAAEWNVRYTRQLPQGDWPLYPVPAPPVEDED
jgi:hypothetical protein